MLVAIATMITAITTAYVALSRKVEKVHGLVNSHLDEIMKALAERTGERDEARRGEWQAVEAHSAVQAESKTEDQDG